jgi:DNA mismatch repair protein MutS
MQAPSVMNNEPQAFEQLPLMDNSHPVVETLSTIDVNDLSPKMALDLLYKLKGLV